MKKLFIFLYLLLFTISTYASDLDLLSSIVSNSDSSRIEKIYSKKLDKEIKQYGYDSFSGQAKDSLVGEVPKDYKLGIGDSLTVNLVGGENESYDITIDKSGQVYIENIGPVSTTSLTLEDFQNILQSRVSNLYLNTKAYVSVNKVHSIKVILLGKINNPGTYTLSSLSNLTDALSIAGGVNKEGSLRNVSLVYNGEITVVDLYEIFAGKEDFIDTPLKNGMRIVIPNIRKTIAVVGDGINENIFETKPHRDLSLIKTIVNISSKDKTNIAKFAEGSILVVEKSWDNSEIITVNIGESVKIFSSKNNEFMEDILSSLSLENKKNLYPFLGIIERFDPATLNTKLVLFNIQSILNKETLVSLKPMDKIILFTKDQIKEFQSKKEKNFSTITEDSIDKYKEILESNSINVLGDVFSKGLYPVFDSVDSLSLINASGGFLPSAKTESIEIISNNFEVVKSETYPLQELKSFPIKLSRGDSIIVKSKFSAIENGSITISGEVRYPGTYTFTRGEKLSSLIARAGGLTNEAYPYGAVFSRESARIKEKEKYKRAVRELQSNLAEYMSNEKKPNSQQIDYVKDLIADIEKITPLGRIVVEANPDILRTEPEKDILLQADDKIFIPKKSLTVYVMGEVLNPSNLQFESGKEAQDYIKESGGFSFYADKGRSFVLLPNGSSSPIENSSWNFAKTSIPEGSTIIVPTDPDPYNFMTVSSFITNVLSQISITTAAIADINDD